MSADPAAPTHPFLALLRHARASPAMPGQDDSERELSPRGRAEFEALVARLAADGFACDAILSSPWKRAMQTAAILGRLCRSAPKAHNGLSRELSSPAARALLAQAELAARDSRIVLVGHDPWIGEIAAHLGVRHAGQFECGEILQLRADPQGTWTVAMRARPG